MSSQKTPQINASDIRPAAPAATDSHPPSGRSTLRVQAVILCSIILILAAVAANAAVDKEKLTPVNLGIAGVTVGLYLCLSWCVFRGYKKAVGLSLFLAMCAYLVTGFVYMQSAAMSKVMGQVPLWGFVVTVVVLALLHLWFLEVLYSYVVKLHRQGEEPLSEEEREKRKKEDERNKDFLSLFV